MSENKSKSYFWAYFTKDINNLEGKCKICGKVYILKKQYDNIKNHIRKKHTNFIPSKRRRKWPFSIIQKHQVKCDKCEKKYNIDYHASDKIKHHLKDAHNIERKNDNWMLHYNYTIPNETMQCIHCNIIFQNDVKHKYFNARKHLIDHVHQIPRTSWKFRLTRNAEDVAVSSGCQQPTYSLDYNVSSSSSSSSTNAMDTSTMSDPQQSIHDYYPLDIFNLRQEIIENIENTKLSSSQPKFEYEDYCAIEDMLK